MRDGTRLLLRPVRPEDEPLYGPFFAAVTPQDLRLRFFAPVKEFGHRFIARLTQIDYARAMAFLAIEEATGNMLGVIRLHADANYDSGEYAVLVRSDLKGRGLGCLLMQMIIEYARAEGLRTIEGQVLSENTVMLAMCRQLGFDVAPDPRDPDTYIVRLAIERGTAGDDGATPSASGGGDEESRSAAGDVDGEAAVMSAGKRFSGVSLAPAQTTPHCRARSISSSSRMRSAAPSTSSYWPLRSDQRKAASPVRPSASAIGTR